MRWPQARRAGASATEQPATDRLGSVARGSLLNLAGAATSAAATFALTVLLTRGLTRGDAGVFFSATALFLLATSLGQLGTSTGLVYFLSRARARGAHDTLARYMRSALRPVLVVAVAMGCTIFLLAVPIAHLIGSSHSNQFVGYLRVLAIFIPLAAVANLSISGTRGMGTMRASAVLDQMGRPLVQLTLVAIAVALSARGLVVWGFAVAYLPFAILARRAWRRLSTSAAIEAGAGQQNRKSGGDAGPAFWRFTAPRAVSSVAQVAMQRLDIILVGAIAGVPQAAVYAAASRFLSLGQLTGGAISQAVQPHLGEVLAHEDRKQLSQLYKTSTGWLVALTWPLYLLFIVLAPAVLRVFGQGYPAGDQVLTVLSLSMLVATAAGMVDMVLMMAGRTSWNLYNVLVAFGLNLGLDLLLIPRMGILGAAIGWAVAILAANLLPLVQVVVAIRVHPFGLSSLIAMGLSTVCCLVIPGIVRLLLGTSLVALGVGAGVGGVCYLGGLWLLRRRLHLSALMVLRRVRSVDSAAQLAG